jgi:hypothetical protein
MRRRNFTAELQLSAATFGRGNGGGFRCGGWSPLREPVLLDIAVLNRFLLGTLQDRQKSRDEPERCRADCNRSAVN